MVGNGHIAFAEGQGSHHLAGADTQAAQVHGYMRGVHHQASFPVEQGTGEIEALFDIYRQGGALQQGAHALGYALKTVGVQGKRHLLQGGLPGRAAGLCRMLLCPADYQRACGTAYLPAGVYHQAGKRVVDDGRAGQSAVISSYLLPFVHGGRQALLKKHLTLPYRYEFLPGSYFFFIRYVVCRWHFGYRNTYRFHFYRALNPMAEQAAVFFLKSYCRVGGCLVGYFQGIVLAAQAQVQHGAYYVGLLYAGRFELCHGLLTQGYTDIRQHYLLQGLQHLMYQVVLYAGGRNTGCAEQTAPVGHNDGGHIQQGGNVAYMLTDGSAKAQ